MNLRRVGLKALIGLSACAAFTTGFAGEAHATGLPATLASYFDGNNEHVLYLNNQGTIQELTRSEQTHGAWQSHFVTLPMGDWGSFLAGGSLTVAWDGTNAHLFYLGNPVSGQPSTADLFVKVGNPLTTSSAVTDLSADLQARPFYASVSPSRPNPGWNFVNDGTTLSGMWDGTNAHVFYAGNDSCVHEAYKYGATWAGAADDHCLGGAAPSLYQDIAGLDLTSLWDGKTEHVFYRGNGGFAELYYSGAWYEGTPPNLEGGFLSATGVGGIENVFGGTIGSTFQVDSKLGPQWATQAVTMPSDTCNVGSPTLAYQTPLGAQFFCTGANGIIQRFLPANNDVRTLPLTVLAETDTVGPLDYSPLTGFYDGSNMHVFYIGTDGHVHEEYSGDSGNTWGSNDLMALSGATPAAF